MERSREGYAMAKIWPVYEGSEPTLGGPWAELPLQEAISVFDLKRDDFVSDLETTPRFGERDRELWYAGFKHIVVEVEVAEGRSNDWEPGFYRSHISPKKAYGKLIQHALAAELGQGEVLRVEYSTDTDSRGEDALRITAIITPKASAKLKSETALDALLRLREQLHKMRDTRTPVVEYATEAELREDVGH